uniref:Uncharacterized protein n=1 Tax=Anguilla anguilla TaxID=7936 RepID=A0A0E9VIG1_ANGAN
MVRGDMAHSTHCRENGWTSHFLTPVQTPSSSRTLLTSKLYCPCLPSHVTTL